MSTDALRADDVYPAPPKAVVLGFRSVLTNPAGDRLTLHLKADGPPLWRQPGETAKAHADSHPEYGAIGPWTVVMTERCA